MRPRVRWVHGAVRGLGSGRRHRGRAGQVRPRGVATTEATAGGRPTCAGSPTRRPGTSRRTPGCARRSGHPPVRVVDRRDWAATNIAGLRAGDHPAGQPAVRRQAARRVRRRGRLPGHRRAGRHRAGVPVRPGARPVRGLLRRPGPAAAGRAEHRRGGAQARGRPARLPALGLPARGHPPHPVHRRAVDARRTSSARCRRSWTPRRAASTCSSGCAAASRRSPTRCATRTAAPACWTSCRPRRSGPCWTGSPR